MNFYYFVSVNPRDIRGAVLCNNCGEICTSAGGNINYYKRHEKLSLFQKAILCTQCYFKELDRKSVIEQLEQELFKQYPIDTDF